MARTQLGFDIGSSSMKTIVLHGDTIRVEEVCLPENMVDEGGNIALPHAFVQFLKQMRKELSLPGVAGSASQPGNLPPGHHAQNDHPAADDESAL